MTKIIVMTDLHVTEPDETIIGLDTYARFCQTRDAALAGHADADLMILMGDLSHHGSHIAYARLAKALSAVPMPIIPMLGNHDKRDAFLISFRDAPQTPHGHIQVHQTLGDHHIITLDTLDGPPYVKGHHSGYLCPDRLHWIAEALTATNGAKTLIFAHHPPFDTGWIGMDNIKLRNGDALLDLLTAHRNCHLFCGHIHRTISGSTRGVPWTMFKATGHQAPLDLDADDSSLSVDEPPTYGLLILTADGVVAHSEDVGHIRAVASDAASRTPVK